MDKVRLQLGRMDINITKACKCLLLQLMKATVG